MYFLALDPANPVVALLGGTTSLLLLSVFAVVNVVVLVLRRDRVDHKHFVAPTVLPLVGAVACVYLVLPWTSGRDLEQYSIAGVLLLLGIVLWGVTVLVNRTVRRNDEACDLTDVR